MRHQSTIAHADDRVHPTRPSSSAARDSAGFPVVRPWGRSYLAYYCLGVSFAGNALAVTDLHTGTTTAVRQPPIDDITGGDSPAPSTLDWTTDSQHVIFSTGAVGRSGAAQVPLAVYTVGDDAGVDLRYHPQPAVVLAAVP